MIKSLGLLIGPAVFFCLAAQGIAFPVAFGGEGYALEASDKSLAMRFRNGDTLRMELPRGAPESLGDSRIIYRSVFAGIDLLVYSAGAGVEYDWIVAAFADPSAIQFTLRGAERVRVDASGDLVIRTASGEVRHRRPHLYQDVDGVRRTVDGGFTILENGDIGFRVGEYNRGASLIIDPQIVYRTSFSNGGYTFNSGTVHVNIVGTVSAVATDKAGNLYITGTSYGLGDSSCPTVFCVYVKKLSADGTKVLYSTLIGTPYYTFFPVNGHLFVLPAAIASDADGNVYVTGEAATLPQVNGGIAKSAGFDDAFVVKLDPTGALKATMLIGGSNDDAGTAIALGADGFVYVAGTTQSTDFPVYGNPFAAAIGKPPGLFALKIDPKALNGDTPPITALWYSTVFTSDTSYSPASIGADSQGNAYIAHGGSVTKINSGGTQASTVPFPTGSGQTTLAGLALDSQGYLYVAGTTYSTDFPTTKGAWITSSKPTKTPAAQAFLTKLSPNGSGPVYSTYLSPDASENVFGLVVDGAGNAYVSGEAFSEPFPGLNSIEYGPVNSLCTEYALGDAVSLPCSFGSGFVTAVKPDGSGIIWSTLLPDAGGDVALDPQGNLYVAGSSNTSGDFAIKISQAGAPIPIDSIVNAASFNAGLPAPGGLATMYVHGLQISGSVAASGLPWPTQLGGVSIAVAGIPAPILSVSNVSGGGQQINFQVPATAPPDGSIAEVDLVYQGWTSTALPARVAPGIFTLPDGSGAIQHASDYSLVTTANPAQKGEVVIVYITGLRPVCYTTSANLGAILYQGPTPGFPGLDQINLQVSANAPSGNNPLTIKFPACWGIGPDGPTAPANDTATNTVTLAVQ